MSKEKYKPISLKRDVWSWDGEMCYIDGEAYATSPSGRSVRIGTEEEHIEAHPIKEPKEKQD